MRKLIFGTLIVALGLVNIPAASAFHGGPYDVVGTATRNGETFTALLQWTGSGGIEQFTITIANPSAPERTVFTGKEDVSNVHFEGCWEVVEPYTAWSTDPSVSFSITGVQKLNLCDGSSRIMYYNGTYEDYTVFFDWTLTLPGTNPGDLCPPNFVCNF